MEHIATLVFDSLTSKPLPGLRGYTFASRRLLFSTGSFDIDIELTPVAEQLSMVGQILGNDILLPAGQVVLCRGEEAIAGLGLTHHGEFHFTLSVAGAYTLRFLLDTHTVTLPAFSVAL